MLWRLIRIFWGQDFRDWGSCWVWVWYSKRWTCLWGLNSRTAWIGWPWSFIIFLLNEWSDHFSCTLLRRGNHRFRCHVNHDLDLTNCRWNSYHHLRRCFIIRWRVFFGTLNTLWGHCCSFRGSFRCCFWWFGRNSGVSVRSAAWSRSVIKAKVPSSVSWVIICRLSCVQFIIFWYRVLGWVSKLSLWAFWWLCSCRCIRLISWLRCWCCSGRLYCCFFLN